MTKKIRVLLAATVVLVALGATASTALALDVEPAGAITMTSLGQLTFDSIIDIDCNFTLEGEVNAAAENRADAIIGSITRSSTANCSGAGEIESLLGEGGEEEEEGGAGPSAIKLGAAWAGPSNTVSLYLEEFTYAMNNIIFIGNCLYMGDIHGTLTTDAEGNTGLWTSSQTAIPLHEGDSGCIAVGRFVGTFTFTAQDLDL